MFWCQCSIMTRYWGWEGGWNGKWADEIALEASRATVRAADAPARTGKMIRDTQRDAWQKNEHMMAGSIMFRLLTQDVLQRLLAEAASVLLLLPFLQLSKTQEVAQNGRKLHGQMSVKGCDSLVSRKSRRAPKDRVAQKWLKSRLQRNSRNGSKSRSASRCSSFPAHENLLSDLVLTYFENSSETYFRATLGYSNFSGLFALVTHRAKKVLVQGTILPPPNRLLGTKKVNSKASSEAFPRILFEQVGPSVHKTKGFSRSSPQKKSPAFCEKRVFQQEEPALVKEVGLRLDKVSSRDCHVVAPGIETAVTSSSMQCCQQQCQDQREGGVLVRLSLFGCWIPFLCFSAGRSTRSSKVALFCWMPSRWLSTKFLHYRVRHKRCQLADKEIGFLSSLARCGVMLSASCVSLKTWTWTCWLLVLYTVEAQWLKPQGIGP